MKRAFVAALIACLTTVTLAVLAPALAPVLASPAFAEKPVRAEAAPNPAAGQTGISPDQAKQALDVLNDPAKRAAFAATLTAIIKAQPAAAPAKPGAAPATEPAKPDQAAPADNHAALPIPLAPDSLGAQVLVSASALVSRLGNETKAALDTVQSLPLLWGWTVVMVTNPVARDLLVDVGWRVAVVLACAMVAEFGLSRLMRRPIARVQSWAPAPPAPSVSDTEDAPDGGLDKAEEGDIEPLPPPRHKPTAWTFLRRVPLVLARLLLDLVPVVGIAVVGHLLAGSNLGGQGGHSVARLIMLAVVDAYALSAALLAVARSLLSPDASRLRLFHLRDDTAAYMMRWTRRLVLIAVIGYAIGEAWLLLGLSAVAHESLQKAVGLLLHICLAIIVLQKRAAMRAWLSAPPGSEGAAASMRNRLAAVWHWIALFFIVAVWLVWAIELPHGYTAILHYFIITAALLIGARLTLLVLLGAIDRATRPGGTVLGLSPAVEVRLRIYLPLICGSLRLAIYLLCVLGLLQLYGLNTMLWLVASNAGLRILSSFGTLIVTVIFAFGVWEAVNLGIQQHLERLQREAQLAKSARLRTLLPLLRSTLLVTVAVVAGLMILSEIGINIAPLLAGAGILGVAIGFGSQKLVQDLITGIFLLLENAMQVGDYVTVSGLSGNVEALSVRTIRLRAADGSVHIIPFSAVTSVTNVNRGLGNASVTVSVDYNQDTDRVCEELKAIVAGMRAEPNYSAMMLSDLQLWGVDKVDGASVTIAGQVVCTDSGRWTVQREFNRRMKRRFQEIGIGIYNPSRTIAMPFNPIPAEQKDQGDGDERARAAE
ncbi:MAG TPA: mechanosensitive ion channel domain-containing protein [Rhodopila sp.]|uniref:mechanosensitive ion channel domain-containing protein n=1 Tax=Rhodopila sp. TaxID=2480087 RepID=UPI002BF2BF65|nr:mechanosensitive ion channel domain-containing protein [Rhodopila sp.]HVY18206.1 mechanosensitive ion channel domain-containing protein [Rhodopila sp.]